MRRVVFAAIGGCIALCIVVALTFTIVAQREHMVPTGPPPTLPEGARPFEMIRPFADTVAWNRPVSEFGRSERFAEYAQRLWNYGSFGGWTDPERRDDVVIEFRNYSVPIYDARTATETRTVYWAGFGFPPYKGASMTIPWNPHWQAAPGNDAIALIADPDSGEVWSVWVLFKANPTTCFTAENFRAGYRPFVHLCAGGVDKLTNADGSDGDYRTWDSYHSGRGMGIPKLALVTTPYEVRAGAIEHALELTVFNTMFGPACSEAELATDAAGNTCGFYVPPATRIEWAEGPTPNCGQVNQPNSAEFRRKTVPEGMRFALDITDADIESWLDERGYTGAKRNTARIFAVALRDYGFIIAETGCYGVSIEVDGFVNPDAAEIWRDLGIVDDGTAEQLLFGLFTEERIYVVEPPEPAAAVASNPAPGLAR